MNINYLINMNNLKKKRVSKELEGLNYSVDENNCTINLEYKRYQVKIVLKSTSIASYPKVKDLRIIALE